MAHYDILVHLRRYAGESLAASVGILLAQRLQAHVLGLYVAALGSVTYSTLETVMFQVQEADDLYEIAREQSVAWQQRLHAHALAGEWLVAQGEPVEAICHAARWCDLIVTERPQLSSDAPIGWGLVSRTVFGAGIPVVVVPETAKPVTVGTRVLVAWNHSREAARAISGALPILRLADEVVVLDGAAHQSLVGARHLPQLDLPRYLARHRIPAQFISFAPKADFGAGVLETARSIGADLIVMGAWGHSRIAELVLGGATRHLFQFSDIPLFVAH